MPVNFPPVSEASEDGLLAIGGDLEVSSLIEAYSHGIFPWPVRADYPMTWFSPDPRGIIELSEFKIGKTLAKFLKKSTYEIKFNYDFESVIKKCSETVRKHEVGTWIYKTIVDAYTELFNQELAYCVGVYEDDELIGGLYGVCIGEIISGESMFHTRSNASKVALVSLVNQLSSKNIMFIDTQMVTPVIAAFGGKSIPRKEFISKLQMTDKSRKRSEIFN